MDSISNVVFYIATFFSVYLQVFLLITFLENRKKIVVNTLHLELEKYPGVTVVVPCYNEEKTIFRTVHSLLELDYPKDKLHLILIDDGSTDNTFSILKQFEDRDNIKVIKKENGGKHTAQNLGLEHTETPFVGCLDSDSLVHPQALKRIMNTFSKDESVSAVIPSILVTSSKNIVEKVQKAEYDLIVFNKKMFSFLSAIHVTPGPFAIFKKKVFDEIGPYRHAHNTEDQEIALRMHKHGYKIENCSDAYVYTSVPKTISRLYQQRVRWTYGFFRNMIDYRDLFFKKKFGNLGFLTLPSGIISFSGVIVMFVLLVANFISFISKKILEIKTIGMSASFGIFKFDFFFINTKTLLFMTIFTYILLIIAIFIGKKMTEGKSGFPFEVLYLVPFYGFFAPFWIIRSFWNAIFKKESSWQMERVSL
jgi:cellulose synthase/poly-beta-1,6-N-acetylglucosamine synthase-like glycosyltransferase